MKVVSAGEHLTVKIQAKDDQSGIQKAEVHVENLRDLLGAPNFTAKGSIDWPGDKDEVEVEVTIPEYIPASKWKVSGISIINGTGRKIKYFPGKDYKPILFAVKAKEGVDLTPAELINVELVD